MKNTKRTVATALFAFLLIASLAAPLAISNANAETTANSAQPEVTNDGNWWKIQTDLITVLFPANGTKPMFLWYSTNDSSRVYVVKYKGLVEYTTIDRDYYTQQAEADPLTIREMLLANYAMHGPHRVEIRNKILHGYNWLSGFHPSFLPFSAGRWNLTGPVTVNRTDGVSYVSFNFTLIKAPRGFSFAENNVIIRCRFYANASTEDVYGFYNYTVLPGELKMDLVIQNWRWNIDKLNSFFAQLQEDCNVTVPKMRAGLALWTDMSSIAFYNMTVAQKDASQTSTQVPESSTQADTEPVEAHSNAAWQRIWLGDMGKYTVPLNLGPRFHARYRLQFANESETLGGFDFVNSAVIINSTNQGATAVNVTAAYLAAGHHLRLFIGYPYFGNNTLVHDPSIGVENTAAETPASVIPENLPLIFAATMVIVTVAAATLKLRKRPIDAVNIH
ncbi:MAG: hypothetical protein NWE99_04105 [Candidatus Bathyarchaeota archaeon]|nr:hypothetical protein [Candidatus Bathyarchaeota archaeon]